MAWTDSVSQDDIDAAQVRWIIGNRVYIPNGQPICTIRGVPHTVDSNPFTGQLCGIPGQGLDVQLLGIHRHQSGR